MEEEKSESLPVVEKVVAKFRCDSIKDGLNEGENIYTFSAVSVDSAENQSFNKWTEIYVNNPRIEGFYEVGKEYYVTFTRAN